MSGRKNSGRPRTAKDFYNDVSAIYDKMIDFEKNFQLRVSAYKNIFPAAGRAADIGCGIGLDSIALALNGHKVTAFDISDKMIAETKINAFKYNVGVDAHVSGFKEIAAGKDSKYNYVLSVGNTIAHLRVNEFESAIKKIYSMLLPGGKIFLHILNYDLIIKQSKRINNIASRGGQVIIRFYDFEKEHIDFNILSFPANDPKNFKLFTTKHYPHNKKIIYDFLNKAGFGKIKFTGTFDGGKFDRRSSKDLFVEAVKNL